MNKWIIGARPRTLPAAIAPVIVGSSLAGADLHWLRALLALFVAVGLQVGVNYSNDYSDGIKGTDENRVGPIRLVAGNLATANQVKRAAITSFFLASVAGTWLAVLTTPWLILVGLLSIAAAWGYTGGKKPYGYFGFGEISVFTFFGLVATVGTFYVQTEQITLLSFIAAIPMGALSCAILAINNLRDRPLDQVAGKNTLAVRFGDAWARKAFVGLLLSAHIFALTTLVPASALTLVLLPMTFQISREVLGGASGKDLIPTLGRTGKLQLLFSLIFALALAI